MTDLEIDTALSYNEHLHINKPFIITNNTQHTLAFKIKTNQKNLLSMHINHGFIEKHHHLVIPIKIVEKPDHDATIKLEVNWCTATDQMIKENDSKMAKVSKDQIKKKVFSIQRQVGHKDLFKSENTYPQADKQQHVESISEKLSKSVHANPLYQSVYESKNQTTNIYTQATEHFLEKSPQHQQNAEKIKQIPKVQQKKISQDHPLQIVCEEDEQDHEKELQGLKNEVVNEKRALDQIKIKIRKHEIEAQAKQIIDFKWLLLILLGSFLLGSFLKHLF